MEDKPSPFAPAHEVPLHKSAPLAPSQELAYRNKCIQLRKRLNEIETNNDMMRRDLTAKKDRINKQRLLRAILLDKLRDVMETPGRKLTAEQLEKLGISDGDIDEVRVRKRIRLDDELLLDDSSGDSDEDVPEPTDRPVRIDRRNQQTYRGEGLITATESFPRPEASRSASGLPSIAPATSYSPTQTRNHEQQPQPQPQSQAVIRNVASTADSPLHALAQSTHSFSDSRFMQSSPIARNGSASASASIGTGASQLPAAQPTANLPHGIDLVNGSSSSAAAAGAATATPTPTPAVAVASQSRIITQPHRPPVPYEQFVAHMRPQLEADSYPEAQIQGRIDEEWHKLSRDNRRLWDERYNEQMLEYETAMDVWRRQHRAQGHHQSAGGQGHAIVGVRHGGVGGSGRV